MSKRYFVRVMYDDGTWAVLSHRDRTSWCYRTAMKHGNEYTELHGNTTYIVEE